MAFVVILDIWVPIAWQRNWYRDSMICPNWNNWEVLELGFEPWPSWLQSVCIFYHLVLHGYLFNTEIKVDTTTYTVCSVLICKRINIILIISCFNYVVLFIIEGVHAWFLLVWDVSIIFLFWKYPAPKHFVHDTVLSSSMKFSEWSMIK